MALLPVGFQRFHRRAFLNYQLNRAYALGFADRGELHDAASGSDVLAHQVRDGSLDVAFLGLAEGAKVVDLELLESRPLARDPLARRSV